MENEKYKVMSLYDYLGKTAGGELGKAVNKMAMKTGIDVNTREIATPKFVGKVFLYPKYFLDMYFNPLAATQDDLPF